MAGAEAQAGLVSPSGGVTAAPSYMPPGTSLVSTLCPSTQCCQASGRGGRAVRACSWLSGAALCILHPRAPWVSVGGSCHRAKWWPHMTRVGPRGGKPDMLTGSHSSLPGAVGRNRSQLFWLPEPPSQQGSCRSLLTYLHAVLTFPYPCTRTPVMTGGPIRLSRVTLASPAKSSWLRKATHPQNLSEDVDFFGDLILCARGWGCHSVHTRGACVSGVSVRPWGLCDSEPVPQGSASCPGDGVGNNKDTRVWGWLPTCIQESLLPARPHGQTAMHCTPVSGHSRSHYFSPPLGGGVRGGGETSVPTTPCGKQQGLAAARGEQQQGRLTCFLPSGRSQKDQEGSLANTRGAFTVSG